MNEADGNLEYDSNGFVGPFNEGVARSWEEWLRQGGWGQGRLQFDPSYLEHIRKYHGGKPKKQCFETVKGTNKVVERFLHFAEFPPNNPLSDSNVKVAWSQAIDRLGEFLIPFAELFSGDMLCFDYTHPGKPRIVVWFHEMSDEDAPYTELVADSFDEFLLLLRRLSHSE